MTDEMLNAMEKAYKMGCDEAREICNNYKIRIEKLEAALRMVVDWDNTLEFEDSPAWGDVMEVVQKALEQTK